MSIEPIPVPEVNEKHRSFTIRVPQELYLRMTTLAQNEGLALNKKVNQILRLGMGEHIKLDDVLMRLIRTNVPEDKTND